VNREVQDIIKKVERLGWAVTRTNSGHWLLRSPDPRVPLIYAPHSPSDWRGLKNLKSLLRRYGVTVP